MDGDEGNGSVATGDESDEFGSDEVAPKASLLVVELPRILYS